MIEKKEQMLHLRGKYDEFILPLSLSAGERKINVPPTDSINVDPLVRTQCSQFVMPLCRKKV